MLVNTYTHTTQIEESHGNKNEKPNRQTHAHKQANVRGQVHGCTSDACGAQRLGMFALSCSVCSAVRDSLTVRRLSLMACGHALPEVLLQWCMPTANIDKQMHAKSQAINQPSNEHAKRTDPQTRPTANHDQRTTCRPQTNWPQP
jgi:hypothetical protein